jgi:hypothetical protein
MFQFVKANKMFSAVVAVAVVLTLLLCYGLAVRNVAAVVLGLLMLCGAVGYSFAACIKEIVRTVRN